jgi:UDP-GlcNAc:undecaprenyl-phosphate GlcNAc-1-phosphate transferase
VVCSNLININLVIFYLLIQALNALLLTLAAILVLRPLAVRVGLLDHPGGRRMHASPAQLTGGIAISLSVIGLGVDAGGAQGGTLILPLALMLLIGVVDDFVEMRATQSMLLQCLVAYLLAADSGLSVQHLGDLVGVGDLGTAWLAVPFTMVCTVGVINAINMVDGMDGVAGSLSLSSVAAFGFLAYLTGQQAIFFVCLVVAGGLMGFLCFNLRSPWRSHATVYLGSPGSMGLGLILTWLAIGLSGAKGSPVPPMTCVWVIGLPLMDMARVMVGRVRRGLSPMDSDRSHLHHVMEGLGLSYWAGLGIKVVLSLLFAAVGVLGWRLQVPEWLMFAGFLGVLGLYIRLVGGIARRLNH